MIKNKERMNGLVLTGGGARAAYQVGALRAIYEITRFEKNPFKVISGFSAGAINGSWLASRSESFDEATAHMWDQWANIESEKVFKTSSASIATTAFRWLKDRTLGGLQKDHQISYLLDTAPLWDFLREHIDFDALNAHLESANIHGFALITANYRTGKSTAFFSGNDQIKAWESHNRISYRTKFSAEHIMASSAIPILFPPIKIDNSYFGDGMVRLTAPLSPAIHMGADRLLVIGVKGSNPTAEFSSESKDAVTLGEVAGTVLNGLFFDSVDTDIESFNKINRMLAAMKTDAVSNDAETLRQIPILSLKPSKELSISAACELEQLPVTIRFLLKGVGVTDQKGMDLLSYLAFEPRYMKSLLELGYADTFARKDEVLNFFET